MDERSAARNRSASRPILGTWVFQSVRGFGWVPFGFFTAHVVATKVFDAYLHLPWLDIPMHFFGGVAIAYFFSRNLTSPLASQVLGSLSAFAAALLVFAGTCSATLVWELAEWTTDSLGFTHAQLGLDDTLLDMALGALGGLAWISHGWSRESVES